MDMLQHFMDQFATRFFDHGGDYPQYHRAVWISAFSYWIIVIIRNPWTAWMV